MLGRAPNVRVEPRFGPSASGLLLPLPLPPLPTVPALPFARSPPLGFATTALQAMARVHAAGAVAAAALLAVLFSQLAHSRLACLGSRCAAPDACTHTGGHVTISACLLSPKAAHLYLQAYCLHPLQPHCSTRCMQEPGAGAAQQQSSKEPHPPRCERFWLCCCEDCVHANRQRLPARCMYNSA